MVPPVSDTSKPCFLNKVATLRPYIDKMHVIPSSFFGFIALLLESELWKADWIMIWVIPVVFMKENNMKCLASRAQWMVGWWNYLKKRLSLWGMSFFQSVKILSPVIHKHVYMWKVPNVFRAFRNFPSVFLPRSKLVWNILMESNS